MILNLEGEIFAHEYKLIRCLGETPIAEVWLTEILPAKKNAVVKVYTRLTKEESSILLRDINSYSTYRHANLLVSHSFGFDKWRPFMEMDYFAKGSLHSKIGSINGVTLAKLVHDIASALACLHDFGIVHQNLKPENILTNDAGISSLADIGLGPELRNAINDRITRPVEVEATFGITHPCYRAPELFHFPNKKPIKASDIWALGANLFHISTGQLPFGKFGGYSQVSNELIPDLEGTYNAYWFSTMIKKCMSKDPWDRPKAKDIVIWAKHYMKNETIFTNDKPTAKYYDAL